jgi:hypothetical protein
MTTPVAHEQKRPTTTQIPTTTSVLDQSKAVEAIALPAISARAKFEPTPFASDSVMVTFDTPDARSTFEKAIFMSRRHDVAFLTEKGSLFPENLRFRSTRAKPHEIFIYWTNDSKLNDSNRIIDTLKAIKV